MSATLNIFSQPSFKKTINTFSNINIQRVHNWGLVFFTDIYTNKNTNIPSTFSVYNNTNKRWINPMTSKNTQQLYFLEFDWSEKYTLHYEDKVFMNIETLHMTHDP